MFDEAYTKLELDEIAVIIDELNQHIDGSIFDALETTILAIEVPFYKGYRFLNVADHATNPPLERFVFQKDNSFEFTIMDWNFKTIYELNTAASISLDENNIFDYVRFYFDYVKGRHGRFVVCETVDHIKWKDEPPLSVRKAMAETLKPLQLTEKRKDGTFVVKAFMMLKDALFIVDVFVDPMGKVTMSDHEILIENIPVLDAAVGA